MSQPEPEPVPEPEPTGAAEPWSNSSLGDFYPEWGWNVTGEGEPEPEAEPSFGPCVQGVLVALAVLIIVVGSVGNSLVIIVIGKMRAGRTVTEVFLTSLAVADLLVCMVCSPLLVVGILVHSGHTGVSYRVEQFLFYFSSVASIFNLTAIALDRYDAVLHPMSRRLTLQRCRPVLVLIWALSAAVAVVIYFMPSEYEFIVLAICFAFPFAAMVISYARILSAAKAAERRAAGNKESSRTNTSKTDKTVKMVIIVVVVFAVSWIPSLISRLLKYVVQMTPEELSVMEVTACLIAYGGSALNFLVYAFMSRRFKIGMSQLFRCHRFIRKVNPADDDIGKTRMNSAMMVTVQNANTTKPIAAIDEKQIYQLD
ncbi:galanin receptor type 1-like [Patiria miniata]|uniref:G-protein coupled receptors family 1 profile domain-containing protein n=1 Tax=Patiria miniata TaxID=46514 RepID=A0A914A886_PATMI|nr:galanin receptor type 1-like [Patiria miniata]